MFNKVVAVKVEAVHLKEHIRFLEKHVEVLEMENEDLMKHIMELKHVNRMDVLCEIFNKREFKNVLDKEISRAERHGGQITLMIVDIDKFKEVNDTQGHHAGDVLLRSVSAILKECIRREDYAFRIGGDEFAVILIDADGAPTQIGVRMLRQVKKDLGVSCTIGCTDFVKGDDYVSFLKRTDALMYSAKETGRGKVATLVDDEIMFFNIDDTCEHLRSKEKVCLKK